MFETLKIKNLFVDQLIIGYVIFCNSIGSFMKRFVKTQREFIARIRERTSRRRSSTDSRISLPNVSAVVHHHRQQYVRPFIVQTFIIIIIHLAFYTFYTTVILFS